MAMMPGDGDGMMPGDGAGMMPGDGDGDGNGMVEEPMLTIPEGLVASSGTPVFADTELLEALLPGGDTVFPPVSAGIVRDYEDGRVDVSDGDTSVKSVSSDGSGGFRLVVVLDGEEIDVNFPADSFMEQDGPFEVEQDGMRFRLWDTRGSFDTDPDNPAATVRTDGSPQSAFFDVLQVQTSGDDLSSNIFLAFGARTRSEDMPQGTATYGGRFRYEAWSEDDTVHDTSRSTFKGAVSLEANFSQGTISGTMDELESRAVGEEYSDMAAGNRIDIANGQIAGGQFTAEWAGHGPEAEPLETVLGFEGNVLGEFYGPAAEELAGVMNGQRAATATASAQVVYGYLYGSTARTGTIAGHEAAFSQLDPVHAETSADTLAANANVMFGPIIGRLDRERRDVKARLAEGDRSALVTSIATDGTGGYQVAYVVDGVAKTLHFEQIANSVSETQPLGDGDSRVYVFGDLTYGDEDPATNRVYHDIVIPSTGLGDGYWTESDSVFGLETRADRLVALGTATYAGGFWARLIPQNRSAFKYWHNLRGELTVDADFTDGQITGLISALELRESEVENPDREWNDLAASNSIVISNGAITDNRFRVDWEGQDSNSASAFEDSVRGFSGEMLGAFYGPDGEETAGIVDGSRDATATTPEQVVQGAFSAAKEEPGT